MKNAVNIEEKRFATPEAVFERYVDMVYRLAFVRTKNTYDADDIIQDVFLRYLKVWKKMESEEHIKAMLIRITINCSNSLLSSNWFKMTEPLKDTLPDSKVTPSDDTLAQVLKLPLKYRTAIHLYYYMGYSVEEIAHITNSNASTVKTRLSRGRERLKKSLKADDFDV